MQIFDDLNPEKTAKELLRIGYPVKEYEEGIQAQRYARLKKFTEISIPVLINSEKELIAYGEEVIRLMKEK